MDIGRTVCSLLAGAALTVMTLDKALADTEVRSDQHNNTTGSTVTYDNPEVGSKHEIIYNKKGKKVGQIVIYTDDLPVKSSSSDTPKFKSALDKAEWCIAKKDFECAYSSAREELFNKTKARDEDNRLLAVYKQLIRHSEKDKRDMQFYVMLNDLFEAKVYDWEICAIDALNSITLVKAEPSIKLAFNLDSAAAKKYFSTHASAQMKKRFGNKYGF